MSRNLHIDLHAGHQPAPRIPLTPEEIAQKKAARYGSTVAMACLWLGLGLALISFGFLARFVYNLHGDLHDAASLIVMAAIYTGVAAILPPMARLHEARYPEQAQFIWMAWFALVGICMIIILAQVAWTSGLIAAGLGEREATLLKAAMLLKGMFFGACPAGAGWLCSLSITGHAESHRLASGEMGLSRMPVAPMQPQQPAIAPPADLFSAWAESRLLPSPMSSKGIEGNQAYLDYSETCSLNGLRPMSEKQFGLALTARSEQMFGPEAKHRSNGKVRYRGWTLPEETREFEEITLIEGPR